MNKRTIPGLLDLGLLSAPSGVCGNCFMTYRASKPRPAFVHCWHNAVVARQRRDGSWKTLQDVTPDELRALHLGDGQP